MTSLRFAESLDFQALWQEFPTNEDFVGGTFRLSRDALRDLQDRRFRAQMQRGWEIPFYRRHWSAAGLEPGDIRSLDDLPNVPPFTVKDLRESIERDPIWPDYLGLDPEKDAALPLVFQTSGGTTGLPRPMFYSPRDREVMNIMTGRRLHMQGVRPFDRVQVTLSLGLSNGGFLVREGIWKYSGAVPVMTGTGNQTPTRRQIELMRAWGIRHLVGFPAYLRHMALVARDEMGLDPRSFGLRGLITHLGVDDREQLEALWCADVFDTYGTNEFGSIAAECTHKSGMHIFEDAFVAEVNDPDTMAPMADGERGVVVLTTLFKHVAPMIRFNTADVSAFVPGVCDCGGTHRRLSRIFGRSDNMIKLRGINVFPEAIGALVAENTATTGEYFCIVEPGQDGRGETMTVLVEAQDGQAAPQGIQGALSARFKEALGVMIDVRVEARGSLERHTGLSQTSKVRRVFDRRQP